jgi:hypothetical protein
MERYDENDAGTSITHNRSFCTTIAQSEPSQKKGQNKFPFDVTNGPGYVWHCHIVDHEDNEMMRPYTPVSNKKEKP